MTGNIWLATLAALAVIVTAEQGYARPDDQPYSIMVPEKGAKQSTPEPWLAPKYKSPRGTRQHITVPRPAPAPKRRAKVPPSLYVPETGRTLPNLPTLSGSGPRGAESSQDRALRCAHQAGVYGSALTGNRNTYIGTCINQ